MKLVWFEVIIVLFYFMLFQFSEERQKAFKGAVAQAINEYCAQDTPEQCVQRRRRKRYMSMMGGESKIFCIKIKNRSGNFRVNFSSLKLGVLIIALRKLLCFVFDAAHDW